MTVQLKKESKSSQSGFSKEWVVTGFASELGIEHLEKHCTSDGINKLFQDVALSTENAVYLPEGGHRDITVSLAPRSIHHLTSSIHKMPEVLLRGFLH